MLPYSPQDLSKRDQNRIKEKKICCRSSFVALSLDMSILCDLFSPLILILFPLFDMLLTTLGGFVNLIFPLWFTFLGGSFVFLGCGSFLFVPCISSSFFWFVYDWHGFIIFLICKFFWVFSDGHDSPLHVNIFLGGKVGGS